MDKFKTLNNSICKQIVFQCAENFNHRILTRMLFNAIDLLSDKVWLRMFNLCVDCGFFTCTEHFADYVGPFSQEFITMHKFIISHLNTISYENKKNK